MLKSSCRILKQHRLACSSPRVRVRTTEPVWPTMAVLDFASREFVAPPVVSTKMKTVLLAAMAASAAAFAPAAGPAQRAGTVAVNAEMSKSIPFLPRPEKLDGSMVGDMGFDPMGLSEIQTDLKYARWAELKHGRAAMLAIVGMVWQEYGPHLPGDKFATRDPFEAISSVGLVGNLQILFAIGIIELANFNKYYGEGEPGDIGFGSERLEGKDAAFVEKTMTQEIVHCRLAMIAILGAVVQTLLFHKPLLG